MLNFYTMAVHVVVKYYGQSNSLLAILVNILSFDPLNPRVIENDLVYVQILVFWMFVDIGFYIAYFSKETLLLDTKTEKVRQACVLSIINRLDLYNYEPSKYQAS